MLFVDEILGALEAGEGLPAQTTARLAETIISAFTSGDDAALLLGLTRGQLKAYFSKLRNAHIQAAYDQTGDVGEVLSLINSLDRVRSISAGTAIDHLHQATMLGMGMPSSKAQIYRIIQNEVNDGESFRASAAQE
jgi:predicted transcriptional regulator